MILPPPGFAQPNPDPSLRPLLEHEMRDLIALARNHVTHGVKGVLIVESQPPGPQDYVGDYLRRVVNDTLRQHETRDPALQLARKETKP